LALIIPQKRRYFLISRGLFFVQWTLHRISLREYRELPFRRRKDGGTFWYYISMSAQAVSQRDRQPVVEYFNAIQLKKVEEILISTNMDIADWLRGRSQLYPKI
ncbi:hypothetical protein JXX19_17945, partial [Ruthenibacterium lactatiformans]